MERGERKGSREEEGWKERVYKKNGIVVTFPYFLPLLPSILVFNPLDSSDTICLYTPRPCTRDPTEAEWKKKYKLDLRPVGHPIALPLMDEDIQPSQSCVRVVRQPVPQLREIRVLVRKGRRDGGGGTYHSCKSHEGTRFLT